MRGRPGRLKSAGAPIAVFAGELLGQAGECVPPRIGRASSQLQFAWFRFCPQCWQSPLQSPWQSVRAGRESKHLFTHDVLEQEPAFAIIPDLGLFFGDGSLGAVAIDAFGAEDEVEVA